MTQAAIKEDWSRVAQALEKTVGELRYRLYLKETLVLELNEDEVSVGVPNLIVGDYLASEFSDVVLDTIKRTLGFRPKKISFPINGHLFRSFREGQKGSTIGVEIPTAEDVDDRARDRDKPARGRRGKEEESTSPHFMNERYQLETFVVGACNKVAFNAAVAISSEPTSPFPTLFIYGACGLGKTHLAQGISQALKKRHPERKVLYISAEYFVNQFVRSIKMKSTEQFREMTREVDCLIVDGVNFFAGKEKTQVEFLHTLEALESSGAQVVLTSDRHPKELEGVLSTLQSRFVQGMVTHLKAPNATTRIAIIKSKIQNLRDVFPNATINYLAAKVDCNIRELEGHCTQLMALASLMNEKITVPVVQEALKGFLRESRRLIELPDIENVVISHFGVRSEELHGRSRARNIATARQACMYLSRVLTQHSLKEIGRFFGNKNHTTVVFAFQKVTNAIEHDPELAATIDALTRQLERRED